jgi:hypothetical protein
VSVIASVAGEAGVLIRNLSPAFGLKQILYIIHALDIHGSETTTHAYIGYERCFILHINEIAFGAKITVGLA